VAEAITRMIDLKPMNESCVHSYLELIYISEETKHHNESQFRHVLEDVHSCIGPSRSESKLTWLGPILSSSCSQKI